MGRERKRKLKLLYHAGSGGVEMMEAALGPGLGL